MNNLKQMLKRICLALLVFAILYLFDIGCIFHKVFGIMCPTCGMSRAMVSLFFLNISGYLYYNIMALPVFIVTIELIWQEITKKKDKAFIISATIVLIINFIYYLFRIFNGFLI